MRNDHGSSLCLEPFRVPASAEHDYLYYPSIGGRGIVKCRFCGKFKSYRLVGYKPEPPKEACYGRN